MIVSCFRYLKVAHRRDDDDEESLFHNRIWIPDIEKGYRLATIIEKGKDDVIAGFRDDQGFLEKRCVRIKECEEPSKEAMGEDLCTLTEPNAATVLDSLTRRYQMNIIHTYCGLFCVSLNPWKLLPIYSHDVIDEYRASINEMPPHIYTVARNAYSGIHKGGRNQSVLITGESGAGKTENTKKMIEFILRSSGHNNEEEGMIGSVGNDVITSGILLESFGNAKTTHNNNSSRFGKFIKIEFDDQAKLKSAQIDCYLLEKSRLVSHHPGERNFHIFYQMIAGLDDEIKEKLRLTKRAEDYKFLNQGGNPFDKDINDCQDGLNTFKAMSNIGLDENEKNLVFRLLSACILTGEIKFGERSGFDMSFVEGNKEIDDVAELIGVKSSKLVDALTQPTIKVGDKIIRKNQNMKKTIFSSQAMAKVIYERLFNYLLDKCNASILEKTPSDDDPSLRKFIGVLDIAGFEIMQKNSFEQFCINYTNERLQQFFNHFMFVKEQVEYMEEGIEWNQMDFANDLQPTIDLIEKPLGLLTLLEEECVVPNGSDISLLEKYCSTMGDNPQFTKSKQSKKSLSVRHFAVRHYAGDVHYNIDGWVEKNRDAVDMSLLQVLTQSINPIMQIIFPNVVENGKMRKGGMAQLTVTFVYKNQLQSLLDCLNSSAAHFIRCVVPNYERIPGKIDGPLILNQLRCNGVLEGIRICRQGYPSRIEFDRFIQRYNMLDSSEIKGTRGKYAASQLCLALNLDKSRYQVGKTKIFCKVGIISELENRRKEKIEGIVTALQSRIRWINAQKDCYMRLRKRQAMLTIQENVRYFSQLAQWPWFRILSLVRPMIPKEQERRRINELEEAIRLLHLQHEEERRNKQREHDEEMKENKKQTTKEKARNRELQEEIERLKMRYEESLKEVELKYKKTMMERENGIEAERNKCKEFEEKMKLLKRAHEEELRELRRMNDEKEMEHNKIISECDALRLKYEDAARVAEDEKNKAAQISSEKDKEMKRIQSEMQQNEDVFGLLEKKYNEQHQKVLKMNDTLRDYERRIDQDEMEKGDLNKTIKRLQECYDNDKKMHETMEEEYQKALATIVLLEAKIASLIEENNNLKLQIAKLETNTEDDKQRCKRQNENIFELQKIITELTDKVGRFDAVMLEEKNVRRKVEREKDKLTEELKAEQDRFERLQKKYDQLKDELRGRDNDVKKLEKKMEDKEIVLQECIKDLKETHKSKVTQLEEKVDTFKRQNSKLENENKMQKMKLETTFEKESSADSDYGRSTTSRLSTIGRQYSLTSLSSFSSFRTKRRESEDLSSSLYLPRRSEWKNDMSQSYSIQRTPSTSNIMEKERRISELERLLQTSNTDVQLLKRELEVYKTSLGSLEKEKESLVRQNMTYVADIENLTRQYDKAEKNGDSLALRLKKAQADSESWKKKHEETINDCKMEILAERKRTMEKLGANQLEKDHRLSRVGLLEAAKDGLQEELMRIQIELTRAYTTIHQLESNVQSQETLGDSIEHQYRNILMELDALREENCGLKAKIRRQYKQIELLTQQDETEDVMNHINHKMDRFIQE